MGIENDSMDLSKALEVARQAVQAAASVAMKFFERLPEVETKADGSPVTVADRGAEKAIREILSKHFPSHSILGEEYGEHAGSEPYRWIIDPIDGTLGFTRGESCWGPLLGLEEVRSGEILVGAIGLPARQRFYWAGRGLGSWCNDQRISVKPVREVAEATLSAGSFVGIANTLANFSEVLLAPNRVRSHGDVACMGQFLDGHAHWYMEAGVNIWDVAPYPVLVEEAGGQFLAMDSTSDWRQGNVMALHSDLLPQVRDLLHFP